MAGTGGSPSTGNEDSRPPRRADQAVSAAPVSDSAGPQPLEAGSPPPATLLKATATKAPTPASELLRVEAGDVQAETVTMERSGADRVSAARVSLDRSGARSLTARSAQLDRSGVLRLNSERAVFQASSAVAVAADEVRLVKSRVLVVVAGNAQVDADTRIFLHVGATSPCTKPVLTTAGATGFGAALGLALVGLRWVGRRR